MYDVVSVFMMPIREFQAVQWLRLHASTAGGTGSIPGWGTKIPQAVQCRQKKKKSQFYPNFGIESVQLFPISLCKMDGECGGKCLPYR